MNGLPAPYGSGALEPPDEPEGDPEPTEHVEGERINFIPRCALCGDSWPCEESERFEEEW